MPLLQSLRNRFWKPDNAVELVVYVPSETPAGEAIYVSGACSKLGGWDPAGVKLRQTDRGVWQARVELAHDEPIEFKVTRGSWEKVERGADGHDCPNTRIDPAELADGVVRHRVERWADAG